MGQPPLILCVDDNAEGLELRKLVLESSGYSVLLATSGEESLALFADNAIDGVVLDYCMPEMDGGQVAKEMRRLKPGVPVILLSGYVREIPEEVVSIVDIFLLKGSPSTSLLQELRKLVPLEEGSQSTAPHRDKMMADAEKVMAASRKCVQRSREFVEQNRDYLLSSRRRKKE